VWDCKVRLLSCAGVLLLPLYPIDGVRAVAGIPAVAGVIAVVMVVFAVAMIIFSISCV
jgi:hypothetical protein